MTKIKSNFVAAKMNKEVDERYIPKGEYIDAMNINVVSDGSGNGGVAKVMKQPLLLFDPWPIHPDYDPEVATPFTEIGLKHISRLEYKASTRTEMHKEDVDGFHAEFDPVNASEDSPIYLFSRVKSLTMLREFTDVSFEIVDTYLYIRLTMRYSIAARSPYTATVDADSVIHPATGHFSYTKNNNPLSATLYYADATVTKTVVNPTTLEVEYLWNTLQDRLPIDVYVLTSASVDGEIVGTSIVTDQGDKSITTETGSANHILFQNSAYLTTPVVFDSDAEQLWEQITATRSQNSFIEIKSYVDENNISVPVRMDTQIPGMTFHGTVTFTRVVKLFAGHDVDFGTATPIQTYSIPSGAIDDPDPVTDYDIPLYIPTEGDYTIQVISTVYAVTIEGADARILVQAQIGRDTPSIIDGTVTVSGVLEQVVPESVPCLVVDYESTLRDYVLAFFHFASLNETYLYQIDVETKAATKLFSYPIGHTQDSQIIDIDLVDNKLLYFNDGVHQPMKVNLCELENDPDYYNQGTLFNIQDLYVARKPPVHEPELVSVEASGVPRNDTPLQFAYQYIYKDGEESTVSMYSEPVLNKNAETDDYTDKIVLTVGVPVFELRKVVATADEFKNTDTISNTDVGRIFVNSNGTMYYAVTVHTTADPHHIRYSNDGVNYINVGESANFFYDIHATNDGKHAIAFDSAGDVYVSSNGANSFQKVGASYGELITRVAAFTSGLFGLFNENKYIIINSLGEEVSSFDFSLLGGVGGSGYFRKDYEAGLPDKYGHPDWSEDGRIVIYGKWVSFNYGTSFNSVPSSIGGTDTDYLFKKITLCKNSFDIGVLYMKTEYITGGDNNEYYRVFIYSYASIPVGKTIIEDSPVMSFNTTHSFTDPLGNHDRVVLEPVLIKDTVGFSFYVNVGYAHPLTETTMRVYSYIYQVKNEGQLYERLIYDYIWSNLLPNPWPTQVLNRDRLYKPMLYRRNYSVVANNSYDSARISFEYGDEFAEKIRVLYRKVGDINWRIYDEVPNIKNGGSFTQDIPYISNAKLYTGNISSLYSNVPHAASVQSVIGGSLVYGNYDDTFTPPLGDFFGVEINGDPSLGTSFKAGSIQQFSIFYFDDYNRGIAIKPVNISFSKIGEKASRQERGAKLIIAHKAPSWATKYKIIRGKPIFNYDVVDYVSSPIVNGIGQITLFYSDKTPEYTPQPGDILEVVWQIGVGIPAQNIRVPVVEYFSDEGNIGMNIEAGHYITISAPDVEGYRVIDIINKVHKYDKSIFYLIRGSINTEDNGLYVECPRTYFIDANGNHLGYDGSDVAQSNTVPAEIVVDDYDVVWDYVSTGFMAEKNKYSTGVYTSAYGRASYVLERDEISKRIASLAYSDKYITETGYNGLSLFAPLDFMDLQIESGAIKRIKSVDDALLVLQENQVGYVLINKQLLTTAVGGGDVSAVNNFLSQYVPRLGLYGCQDPETLISRGNRRYFVDRDRATVMRDSQDGLTELGKGCDQWLKNLIINSDKIMAGYDPEYDGYVLILIDGAQFTMVRFNEKTDGYDTCIDFQAKLFTNSGSKCFASKDGIIYSFNDGDEFQIASLTCVLNDAPEVIKTFDALSLECTEPWKATLEDSNQATTIEEAEFEEIEGFQYSHIPMDASAGSTSFCNYHLGIVDHCVVVGANLDVYLKNEINRVEVMAGDTVKKIAVPQLIGKIAAIDYTAKKITISATTTIISENTNLYGYKIAKLEGNRMRDYYLKVKLDKTDITGPVEIAAINAEVKPSK